MTPSYFPLPYAVCLNNTSTVKMTLYCYTQQTRGNTVCDPSKKNMFLFISKQCLPPPYGCNPPYYWSALCVKQMAACCFTLLYAVAL